MRLPLDAMKVASLRQMSRLIGLKRSWKEPGLERLTTGWVSPSKCDRGLGRRKRSVYEKGSAYRCGSARFF